MSEKPGSITGRTFFDTDHDNNFKIEGDDFGGVTTDLDETTRLAEEAAAQAALAGDNLEEEEEEIEEQLGDEPGDEEEVEEEDDSEGSMSDEFSFSPLATDLIDDGILDIEDLEKYEDSPEGFKQMIQDTVNKRFDERVKALSPKAQRLLELEQEGGDINVLLEMEAIDYDLIDLDDADNQKTLITEKLQADGYDEDEIEERLQDLEDLGKLEKEAKIAHRFLAKRAEDNKNAVLEQQKKANEEYRVQVEAETLKFKEQVVNTREIAGIKLTKKQAEDLYDYITKPAAKVAGKVLTKYEAESTLENQLKQAFFQMVGYNFSNIETKAMTSVSKKVKQELAKYKDKNQKASTFNRPKEEKVATKIPSFWAGDTSNTL
jgi:hypothetical protein